jgi:hypothetical protein
LMASLQEPARPGVDRSGDPHIAKRKPDLPRWPGKKETAPALGEAETVLGAMPGAARHKVDVGCRPADANKFRVTGGLLRMPSIRRGFFVEPFSGQPDIPRLGDFEGPVISQRRRAIILRLSGAVPSLACSLGGQFRLFRTMEHRGIQYQVVETADPRGWKWTVQLTDGSTKTGVSFSRGHAVFYAICAIDLALKRTPEANKGRIGSR